jgi:hypothetical protein
MFFNGQKLPIVITSIVFCVSTLLGVLAVVVYAGVFVVPYGSLIFPPAYMFSSMVVNILVTSMICAKILRFRSRVKTIVGGSHTKQYVTTTAIFIESAVLYSITVGAVCICWYISLRILYAILPILGFVQVSIRHSQSSVSPYRVSLGHLPCPDYLSSGVRDISHFRVVRISNNYGVFRQSNLPNSCMITMKLIRYIAKNYKKPKFRALGSCQLIISYGILYQLWDFCHASISRVMTTHCYRIDHISMGVYRTTDIAGMSRTVPPRANQHARGLNS